MTAVPAGRGGTGRGGGRELLAGSAPARPDAVRRHNLARLIGEIHRDGELSRADLTARLDLNRSTIGTLVGELVSGGLLANSAPDVATRADLAVSAGRPSHVVGPRADGPYVLALDVEVDRFAVAAVGVGGALLWREDAEPAAHGPEPVALAAARALERAFRVVPGFPVGIGVSVPGSVERGTDRILLAPNLEWRDVTFAPLLQAALRSRTLRALPVRVGNDANLSAVAEQTRGRARGESDLVFLLGRVGVGAGIIAGSRLLTGSGGGAGEVGHLCLADDGPLCHCGNRGCVEVFIGDAALLAAAGRRGETTREAVGAVLDDAAAGSPRERTAVRRVARDLGRTVAALLNLVNPSVVVVGGTLARIVELAGGDTRDVAARYSFGRAGESLQLHVSSIRVEDSCLQGAAELAFAPLMADPSAFVRVAAAPA